MRIAPLIAGLLLLAVSASAAERPNFVLLYADDIGWGDLGCYGAKVIPTPNLDRLASQGVRFTAGYCTSATCTPSRYSLLTGEYAWRRQGTGVLPGDARMIIRPGRPTMASSLAKMGYATGVVGKWHLGLGSGDVDWNGKIAPSPNDIGFGYSFIMAATGDRVPTVYVEDGRVVGLDPKDPIEVSYKSPYPGDPDLKLEAERAKLKMDWSHGHNMALVNGVGRIGWMKGGKSAVWNDETMGDAFAGKACEFIARSKGRPFLLYYASHENHVPRLPHPRYAGRTPLGPRGDAVVAFDDQVGRILAELDRHGLTERTVIVVSSDNGPILDDGYKDQSTELNAKAGHEPAGPFRSGKYSILEGGTRVPFIVRWPGRAPAGKVSDALVSQVDLPATFVKLAGGDAAEYATLDARDHSAALLGGAGRELLVSSTQGGQLSVRDARWKYIPGTGQKGKAAWKSVAVQPGKAEDFKRDAAEQGKDRLFDLVADPAERDNVAAAHPEVVARLKAALDAERAKGFNQPLGL
jgi:arylsulfatase A-like enzyme